MNNEAQSTTFEQETMIEVSKLLVAESTVLATVGEQLAALRKQKNWSIQQVAEQLKLSQGQIAAIESNQFSSLPQMVIVRGFVRAYAKLLKIDADPLIAMLPQESAPVELEASLRPALSTPFVDSRLSLLGHHDNNRKYIIGAVAIVILVGVFLLLQRTQYVHEISTWFNRSAQSSSGTSASTINTITAEATNPSKPAISEVKAEVLPVVASTASISNRNVSDEHNIAVDTTPATIELSAASKPQIAEVKTTSTADVLHNGTVQRASGASGNTQFILKFRENSWVQVKKENGAILSSHLAKAGTEESFDVTDALMVKIGNVAGVEVELRGEPMKIPTAKGNNVASFLVK